MPHRCRLMVGILMIFQLATLRCVCGQSFPGAGDNRSEPFADIPLFRLDASAKNDDKSFEPAVPVVAPGMAQVAHDILYVNDLGDPQRLVFEGVTRFREEQLRLALALDIPYQVAARPSNETANFLDTLKSRLEQGYLHSGCPEIRVSARRDSQRRAIVVRVEEGPKYKMGQVRVMGSVTIEEGAIAKWLTTPQVARPWQYVRDYRAIESTIRKYASKVGVDPITFWHPGDAVDYRDAARKELENGIASALADLGFGDTQFRTEFTAGTDADSIDLVIHILEDARECTVAAIEVIGLSRDSRESLLSFLGVAVGDRLDAKVLQRVNDKLDESCRYVDHGIVVLFPPQPAGDSASPIKAVVLIGLTEFLPSPKLDEPLSPVDQALRKAAHWIESLGKGAVKKDLVVSFRMRRDKTSDSMREIASVPQPGILNDAESQSIGRIVVSREGFYAEAKVAGDNDWRVDHAIAATAQSIEVIDWQNHTKFAIDKPQETLPLKLTVRMQHGFNPDQSYANNLSIGLNINRDARELSHGQIATDIVAKPISMIFVTKERDRNSTIENGVLTISRGAVEKTQFDAATGELIKSEKWSTDGELLSSAHLEAGAWTKSMTKLRNRAAEFPNACDDRRPVHSAVNYLVDELRLQPYFEREPARRAVLRVVTRLLEAGDLDSAAYAARRNIVGAHSGNEPEPFEIPAATYLADDESKQFTDQLAPYLPIFADRSFQRGSWPWTLMRELSFYHYVGHDGGETAEVFSKKAFTELNRLHTSGQMGPASLLMAASIGRILGEYQSYAARQGLHDLSDEAFLKDIRLLTDGDRWFAVAARAITEQLRKLSPDEQEQLAQTLPDGCRDPFVRLLTNRRQNPNELPGESIVAALLDSWHNGLRDTVEAKLRKYANESSAANATK